MQDARKSVLKLFQVRKLETERAKNDPWWFKDNEGADNIV